MTRCLRPFLYWLALLATGGVLFTFLLDDSNVMGRPFPWNCTDNSNTGTRVRAGSSAQPPELLALAEEVFTFVHPGKGGGGSFLERAQSVWRFNQTQCHPNPCHNLLETTHTKETSSGGKTPTKKLIISIRDPIDRFVSAFYWRTLTICNPHGDPRTPKANISSIRHNGDDGKVSSHPDLYCFGRSPTSPEVQALFDTYHGHADALARALCSDNASMATRDIAHMKHVQWSLVDWFAFLPDHWPDDGYQHAIFPIVLEPTVPLEAQLDESIVWLYNQTAFESAADFAQRQAYVQRGGDHAPFASSMMHSAGSRKLPLSDQGERCLARYYQQDYRLLRKIRQFLCKSDTCRDAITAIFDRRREILERGD